MADGDTFQLVMPGDGSEVDDDDVFALLPAESILMVVKEGEKWESSSAVITLDIGSEATVQSTPATTVPFSEPSCSSIFSKETVPYNDNDDGSALMDLFPSIPPSLSPIETPESSESGDKDDVVHVADDGPTFKVPQYSEEVLEKLQSGKVHQMWSLFIQETAHGIRNQSDIRSKEQYDDVCKAIFKKFPCVGDPNDNVPWRKMKKALSQKIRHIRYGRKRCSEGGSSDSTATKRPKCLIASPMSHTESSSATGSSSYDAGDKAAKLLEEWNTTKDMARMATLMKHSFVTRRAEIAEQNIHSSLTKFPFLTSGTLLRKEFELLNKSTTFPEFQEKWNLFMKKIARMKDQSGVKTSLGDSPVDLLKWVEEKVSAKTKKTVFQEIESRALKKLTESKKKVQPYPVLYIVSTPEKKDTSDAVNNAFISMGTTWIDLVVDTLELAVYSFLAFFYVLDCNYPLCCSQILGFIQETCFGLDDSFEKSAKYKSVKQEFDSVKV